MVDLRGRHFQSFMGSPQEIALAAGEKKALSGSGGWRVYVMNIQIGELLHTSCAGAHIVTWESLM